VSSDFWKAPVATQPVNSHVRVPGSKSVTNRALVLAALADGPSLISAPLHARDTKLMAKALQQMGVGVAEIPTATGIDWRITPAASFTAASIDCGLAGTVMRFLPPLAVLANGPVRFDGDPTARIRPMATIVDALRQLGVAVSDDGRGTLPFTVDSHNAEISNEVLIDASASSQFVSALLLVAARLPHGLTIRHQGRTLPSMPHIEMSIEMLQDRGVVVESNVVNVQQATWKVKPSPIKALDITVEPDLSNALPFLAAAMATGGKVSVPDWPTQTTQPGGQLPALLEKMGAKVLLTDNVLTVQGPAQLIGLQQDLGDVGELTPVLAALCALATTNSHLSGIAHLRGHETDRLTALAAEINRLGGECVETADGLFIKPAKLHGGKWLSYEDHRMATAGAVIGLVVADVEVEDIATTSKTLPDFPDMWRKMLDSNES
jgi:3-phosphoshikimate 1-carboxyvinyltransferase